MIKDFLALVFFVGTSQLAGVLGSFFTFSSLSTWYAGLERAAFTPPDWIFGPVWTTLYLLMGIAAWLVWRRGLGSGKVRMALYIFFIQLVLNTLWSVIFFGWHLIGVALVEIVFLWLAILATLVTFARVSKLASWLLFPYLLWVSFAIYLNFSLWLLN